VNAAPDPKSVVNYLLTQWMNRLCGSIDFWTVVCLKPVVSDPSAWLAEQGDVLRSLLVVVGAELRSFRNRRALGAWEGLKSGCDEWLITIQTLRNFRNAAPDEILAACRVLVRLYPELCDAVAHIGQILESPNTFVEEMTGERRAYFYNILQTLPAIFLAARVTETADAAH
jgi:hypothetical protein